MNLRVLLLALTLLAIQSVKAINPVKEYAVTPAAFGVNYEEVTFTTDDNVTLYGWYYKTPKTSGRAIILSHDGEGNMADLIELASQFVTLGYNVLTYDYRGFGKSDPFEINTSFFIYAQFEKDLRAAIEFIRIKKSGITSVALYGQGIGASLSICIGIDEKRISRIIADSPYGTLNEIQKKITEQTGTQPLLPLAFNKNYLEPFYAFDLSAAQSKKFLFIAGENDPIYSPKYIKELSKKVKDNSTVYVVKGAKSSTTFITDKAKYFDEIKTFLSSN